MKGRMAHCFKTRVYYEDTDLAGIVILCQLPEVHRARPDRVGAREGCRPVGAEGRIRRRVAVRRIEAPTTCRRRGSGDDLIVETRLSSHSGARIVLVQNVLRERRNAVRRQGHARCIGRRRKERSGFRRKFADLLES